MSLKVVKWIDPSDSSPSPVARENRPADYLIYLQCSDLRQCEKERLGNEAWGRLMFEAWHPGVEDKMGYSHYYLEVPQGEAEHLPTEKYDFKPQPQQEVQDCRTILTHTI